MLDYVLTRQKTLRCPVFRFNPDIYFRQRACCVSVVSVDVQFLLSDQVISKRHETGNIPLPGVPTLSSFPIFFLKQTNKTLVSLLSFKVDLTLKSMILSQFSSLSQLLRLIGNGKILFQNMQVLLITWLSAIDPGQLNEEQFVYMHVI